jgi:hypothetical protein
MSRIFNIKQSLNKFAKSKNFLSININKQEKKLHFYKSIST